MVRARYKAFVAGLVLLTEIYHIAFSDDPLGFWDAFFFGVVILSMIFAIRDIDKASAILHTRNE